MKKPIAWKGTKFLYGVVGLYALLFLLDRGNALVSGKKSLEILLQLLPIFLLIIVVSAAVNYFVKPRQIIKHFGKESGKRGVLYALLAGIVSHGPMYVWYGMIQELRDHGARDGLLMVFFYARAVKIPMLPFMIGVFGLTFTIIINLYILLFAVIQGWITDRLPPTQGKS